jgi:hypothetical protein
MRETLQTQALIETLPDLEAGDRVTVHEPECPVWDPFDGRACDCGDKLIVVWGPSGKA